MPDKDRKIIGLVGIILIIWVISLFFFMVHHVDDLQTQINLLKFELLLKEQKGE